MNLAGTVAEILQGRVLVRHPGAKKSVALIEASATDYPVGERIRFRITREGKTLDFSLRGDYQKIGTA